MNDPAISSSEKENISQAAGIVGFYTFLSRILGLIRDMVVARFFGSGMAADAFFVAFRIPNLLRRLFAEGSLTIAFIPVFTEYLHKKTKADAFELARVVLTILSLILAVVTLIGIICSPWIVRIQAFGFGGSGVKYELTVLLTRITFPYIFLISLVALFMGILNSLKHFSAPAAAPIFLNIGIIMAILWISPHLSQPVVGVAIGVLIGGILQLGLQIPWIVKKGMSLIPIWMPGHPGLRRIGVLMVPAIFGSAVYQLNQFIGTLLASLLEEGSVSWLYYADRLVQFPLGVFAIAISTAALPSLSRQAAGNKLEEFKESFGHSLRLVFFISIPSLVGLCILGRLIIQVIFERGAFDAFSTTMTFKALIFYSVGLWAFSGIRVTVSAFYAFQDTKTPVRAAVAALAVNLLFSLALMGPLKHGGLALALSIASAIQFCILIYFIKKRIHGLDFKPIIVSTGKSIFASAVMGSVVYYLCFHLWVPDPAQGIMHLILRLACLVFIGASVYFALAAVMGCRELESIMKIFNPVKK